MNSQPPRNLKTAQAEWYARLKESGFDDIEDHSYEDKPLKRWSGIPTDAAVLDVFMQQTELAPIQSSWPDKRFAKEERLLNHADFDDICSSICGHGNHKLVAAQIRQIWEMHLEGETNRGIAKSIAVNHVTVYRCITSLTAWAETMGEEQPEISTVVIRQYEPDRDAAMLFSTWRNALWFDTPGRDESLNHKFFRDCTKLIKTIVANKDAVVKVACLSDDPNLITGMAVLNKTNLIWVYVKADYREKGIATLLTKGFTTVASPSTRIGKAIVKDKELKIHGQKNEGV